MASPAAREAGLAVGDEERLGFVVAPNVMCHRGAPVLSGTKYVLRTDVMYRRAGRAA